MTRAAALAVLAGSASGLRVSKRGGEKFIAGIPVLNYEDAYNGQSLGEFGASQAWDVVLKKGAANKVIDKMCAAGGICTMKGHPSTGGLAFLTVTATEQELEKVLEA